MFWNLKRHILHIDVLPVLGGYSHDSFREQKSCMTAITVCGKHTLIVMQKISDDFSIFFCHMWNVLFHLTRFIVLGRSARLRKNLFSYWEAFGTQSRPNLLVKLLS